MKSDGKLGRNMLKGFIGDQINASLCAVGHGRFKFEVQRVIENGYSILRQESRN